MLKRKLASAAAMGSKIRQLSKDTIIYDTKYDSLWLKEKKDSTLLQDFDQKLISRDDTSYIE